MSFGAKKLTISNDIFEAILCLQLMPTVIFINSVVSVLYHVGLMQMLVEIFAVLMHVTMRTTAAETVCSAASMFLGQVMIRYFDAQKLERIEGNSRNKCNIRHKTHIENKQSKKHNTVY